MPNSIQEYLKQPYARILIPDEHGGYSAEILEFPGCFAEGETPDETMQTLERAAESWIQAALDQGQEIPPPFMNQDYGGKVSLRMPRSIHRKAVQFAARDGTSLNQYLLSSISAGIGAGELYNRLVSQLTETISKKIEDSINIAFDRISRVAFVNNFHHVSVSFGYSSSIRRDLRIAGFLSKASTRTEVPGMEVSLNG